MTAAPDTTDGAKTQDGSRANAGLIQPRGRVLALLVFVGGISSIAIETGASRLIAPYFGTSTFIWANLIGFTLLYLTLGYLIGGRLADRFPIPGVLFSLIGAAGAATAFMPYLARPILRTSLDAFNQVNVGSFVGSLIGTLLLFAVPITLLGMVSPFAVRLRLEDVHRAGNTAGSLYALSTIGSIIGAILPAFVLVPLFGSRDMFLVLALSLMIPAVVALVAARAVIASSIVAGLILASALLPLLDQESLVRPADVRGGRVIAERETPYNYIQVVQRGTERLLILNEGRAIHSVYDPNRILTGGPWDYFLIGPYVVPHVQPADVDSVLMIGLAAGTSARQFTEAYGPIKFDGVEIDQGIVDLAREHFAMNQPNLKVFVEDGRYHLEQSDEIYDVIGIDAYRQPYIPFHLTTKEFFEEVETHLDESGVAVVNAGRTENDFRLVEVIASTMDAVFDDVYLIDVQNFSNTMVIGVNGESGVAHFIENVDRLPDGSLIEIIGRAAIDSGDVRRWNGDGMVFTDDRAPVELVVDQIILDEAQRR